MKIAIFKTNYLRGETARNKAERFFNYLPFSFKFSPAIFRRRDSSAAFEKRDKRAEAVKADRKTRFGNARSGFQKLLCFFDSDSREILMRRFSVDSFKRADKMKLGIAGLVGDLAGINIFLIIAVNEKFCLNDTAIKINFGQVFYWHRVTNNNFFARFNPYRIPPLSVITDLCPALLRVALAAQSNRFSD